MLNDLDTILIQRITQNDIERIWMVVPEVVPWERIDGFRFGLGRRSPLFHDIHLPEFRESVRDIDNLSKQTLTQKKVFKNDWSQLQHHIIVLKRQPASIAVSSMFSLDHVDAPETPRVT